MHRPTFHPAVASSSSSFGGFKTQHTSAKSQPGHKQLKYRQHGQNTEQEMRYSDMRMELQKREAALDSEKKMALAMIENEEKTVELPLLLTDSVTLAATADINIATFDDQDADFGDSDDSDDESSSDDDDDDDDEEELQRELEKIKAERLAAAQRKEEEQRQLEENSLREGALRSNPLMQGLNEEIGGQAKIKRKWNDDVVFRNQASTEPEVKKRFINDTIRNDFHRSFLRKYMA